MRSVLHAKRSGHVMSAIVCGLDVHKDSTYAPILNPGGKIVSQMRMNNERMLSYLSRFNVDRVALESSNQVASLYRKLAKRGYSVFISHPKKRARQSPNLDDGMATSREGFPLELFRLVYLRSLSGLFVGAEIYLYKLRGY